MIHIKNYRREKQDPPKEDSLLCELDESLEEALDRMIKVELKWGGFPTAVTEDSLILETRVLSKIDTTEFAGPVEEMEVLLGALELWEQSRQEASVDEMAVEAIRLSKGKPLLITLIGGMVEGRQIAKGFVEKLRQLTA